MGAVPSERRRTHGRYAVFPTYAEDQVVYGLSRKFRFAVSFMAGPSIRLRPDHESEMVSRIRDLQCQGSIGYPQLVASRAGQVLLQPPEPNAQHLKFAAAQPKDIEAMISNASTTEAVNPVLINLYLRNISRPEAKQLFRSGTDVERSTLTRARCEPRNMIDQPKYCCSA